jgi:hypothetical protein
MSYEEIEYDNKKYIIVKIKKKNGTLIPTVMDNTKQNRKLINNYYFIREKIYNYVRITDNNGTHFKLHRVIFKNNNPDIKCLHVRHINLIGLDNRIENLICDEDKKVNNNNAKYGRSSCNLPEDCGISIDEIPTNISYVKNGSFKLQVNKMIEYSSSSVGYSLRYKLEEIKAYFKIILNNNSALKNYICIDGQMNNAGIELKNGFIEILRLSEYDWSSIIQQYSDNDAYDPLRERTDLLTNEEIIQLEKSKEMFVEKLKTNSRIKRSAKELIINGENVLPLPEHCYYDGSRFSIKKHKNQTKSWKGKTKNLTLAQQYDAMLAKLNEFDNL